TEKASSALSACSSVIPTSPATRTTTTGSRAVSKTSQSSYARTSSSASRTRSSSSSRGRRSPSGASRRPFGSAADNVQHLGPLALHQLVGARLEVEPQKRFGVRRTDVEVPVLGVDGNAVELRDRALVSEARPQLRELRLHVRNGRVQLAGDEVALAQGTQDLGQRLPLPRDCLEHEQYRAPARVRLPVVTIV